MVWRYVRLDMSNASAYIRDAFATRRRQVSLGVCRLVVGTMYTQWTRRKSGSSQRLDGLKNVHYVFSRVRQ